MHTSESDLSARIDSATHSTAPSNGNGAAKGGAEKQKPAVRARGKRNKRSRQGLWRYTAGDHGHAVTVYEKKGKRNIYIEWWSPSKNGMERHSLHHSDQEEARRQAREMSDRIRLKTEAPVSGSNEPTLDAILQLYCAEHGQKLGGHQPAEHERRKRMWLGFFKQQVRPIEYPSDLDAALFATFVNVRRHGDLDVEGIALPEAAPTPMVKTMKREAVVSDGTIDADLIYLNAALNWATRYRVGGRPLLREKPHVPRCKPQKGTLRQPVATEDDLEALRPVLDEVDPQKLLRFWVELVNQFGWRVTGLSHVKACEVEFTPRPHSPHGRLLKNPTVDKEGRSNDSVPLSENIAALLRELLTFRGLKAGDDAYLFPSPMGDGEMPWSRWHVSRLLERAEEAANIAHIGGLHAWRRKWHTERKDYPAQDVAAAAGYADTRSVDRYRHADPETTYLVVTKPSVVLRRVPKVEAGAEPSDDPGQAQDSSTPMPSITPDNANEDTNGRSPMAPTVRPRKVRLRRREEKKTETEPLLPAEAVGQGRGSAGHSIMPNGAVVASRDERFEVNLAVAKQYAATHGHLLPNKHERPDGVNLLMWLKNQEIRIAKGTMPEERKQSLEAIPEWRERLTGRG